MKRGGGLRNRLVAWVMLVSGLILVAVMLFGYTVSRTRLEQDMKTRASSLADGAARRIDAQLGLMQGVVEGMALSLKTRGLTMPQEEIRALQNRVLEQYSEIYGVCLGLEPDAAPAGWTDLAPWSYRAGGRICYENLDGRAHDHTREDWYTLPRYLACPVWTEPYAWNGVVMVTYSVPLFLPDAAGGENRFVGVITCDLALDWLEIMLADLPLGQKGYGILLSRNGVFIAHPQREKVLNETIFSEAEERGDTALRRTGRMLVSGKSGVMPHPGLLDRDPCWLAWTPLHTADWVMVALISQEEMKAAVLRLSQLQGLIGLAGLFLLALTVVFMARSITRPLRNLSRSAAVLASGDLNAPLPAVRGHDEVAELTTAFDDMRHDLKKYLLDLKQSTEEQERMNSELRIARGIQMGLLPKTFPPFPSRDDLDLFALLEPAREVGGDFYDFFLLEDGRLVAVIGDVSGKGVPAALFMAVTRSFLRSAFHGETDPGKVLAEVNSQLLDGNDACMFVTLFCAVLEMGTGALAWASAGHNPPLVLNPEGTVSWVRGPGGPVAGVMPGAVFPLQTMTLPLGAHLCLYTDGVTEAMNRSSELFGEDRLSGALTALAPERSCQEVLEGVVARVKGFADGADPSDDLTLLVLKRRPPGETLVRPVPERLEELGAFLDGVDAVLEPRHLGPRTLYLVRLALEELLSNTLKYGYDAGQERRLELQIRLGSPLRIRLTDNARPFDPLTQAPPPVLEGAVEERPVGGLGLHTLKGLGISMAYAVLGGGNQLDLVFPVDGASSGREEEA